MQHVPCNLCGSDDAALLFKTRDRNWRVDGEFNIVRCRNCGLIYVNPRPPQDEIWKFYPWAFMSTFDLDGDTGEKVGKHRLVGAPLVRAKKPGRVLDIGCGSGHFLQYLKTLGWDVHGIEPRAEAAECAIRRVGPTILNTTVENAAFPEKHFDAVTMIHVLEHIYEPADMLRSVRAFLKDDGVLMAEVPNIASLEARIFGERWVAVDAPRHLYHFTPATLAALFRKAGYSRVEIVHGAEYKYKIMSASESLRHLISDLGIRKYDPKPRTVEQGRQQRDTGKPSRKSVRILHSVEATAFDVVGRAAALSRLGSRITAVAYKS